MRRLRVDYNAIQERDIVTSLRERSPEVVVGERVYTLQDEEDHCEGVVVDIKHGLIYTKLDWETWGKPIIEPGPEPGFL